MIIPKLALRNILGAGIRTWLNVIVLSFAFVTIIWTQGLYQGMSRQSVRATVDAEYGGGQYWQENYDPLDPLSLEDGHGPIPEPLTDLIAKDQATAILVIQGTIYPNGRIQPILIKGIDPQQRILSLPSAALDTDEADIPAFIGTRMAKNTGLKVGDTITLRWRDVQGTFDARDVEIVEIMNTTVPTVDQGQIWVPLETIQELAQMSNEASLIVLQKDSKIFPDVPGWNFKSRYFLLSDIRELVQSKSAGATILYFILILLAMLAIFDTQVLSIFRRRKEMGTLMSLGMTRWKIIQLFTLEGALHGVLAAIVAAIYGIPLLTLFAKKGWALPGAADSYGFAFGQKIFPVYSVGLVLGTTLIVLIITTIVSFLPTRKIAKLKPTDALRGRMS
ncbi:MAG: FtsX-like permease family protein [Candidatus Aminicenantes bacterium]|jgi:ABC-type lipoprotein release transport system permease subunit